MSHKEHQTFEEIPHNGGQHHTTLTHEHFLQLQENPTDTSQKKEYLEGLIINPRELEQKYGIELSNEQREQLEGYRNERKMQIRSYIQELKQFASFIEQAKLDGTLVAFNDRIDLNGQWFNINTPTHIQQTIQKRMDEYYTSEQGLKDGIYDEYKAFLLHTDQQLRLKNMSLAVREVAENKFIREHGFLRKRVIKEDIAEIKNEIGIRLHDIQRRAKAVNAEDIRRSINEYCDVLNRRYTEADFDSFEDLIKFIQTNQTFLENAEQQIVSRVGDNITSEQLSGVRILSIDVAELVEEGTREISVEKSGISRHLNRPGISRNILRLLWNLQSDTLSRYGELSMTGISVDQEDILLIEEFCQSIRVFEQDFKSKFSTFEDILTMLQQKQEVFADCIENDDDLCFHFTPYAKNIFKQGKDAYQLLSAASGDIEQVTGKHSKRIHFSKPGNWYPDPDIVPKYIDFANRSEKRGFYKRTDGIIPDGFGVGFALPMGVIIDKTPLQYGRKTSTPEGEHISNDTVFMPRDRGDAIAYDIRDAFIFPAFSTPQISEHMQNEQEKLSPVTNSEQQGIAILEQMLSGAGFSDEWIQTHFISQLPRDESIDYWADMKGISTIIKKEYRKQQEAQGIPPSKILPLKSYPELPENIEHIDENYGRANPNYPNNSIVLEEMIKAKIK